MKDDVISYTCPPPVIRSYQHSSSPKWTRRNPPSLTRWLKCRCSECQLMLLKKRHLLLKTMVPSLSNTIYVWFVQYFNAVYMKQILAAHVFYIFEVYFPHFVRSWAQHSQCNIFLTESAVLQMATGVWLQNQNQNFFYLYRKQGKRVNPHRPPGLICQAVQ